MKQVISSTDKVVTGTDASQLGLPSPCTEWTVRDVINHITGGSTMFAVCVEEGSVPDDLLGKLMGGDNLGDDYVGAWNLCSLRAQIFQSSVRSGIFLPCRSYGALEMTGSKPTDI